RERNATGTRSRIARRSCRRPCVAARRRCSRGGFLRQRGLSLFLRGERAGDGFLATLDVETATSPPGDAECVISVREAPAFASVTIIIERVGLTTEQR